MLAGSVLSSETVDFMPDWRERRASSEIWKLCRWRFCCLSSSFSNTCVPKSKLQNDKNGCGELARRGCFARSWPEHIQNICFNYISPTWPFCTIDRVALFLCCPERLADRGDLSIHVRVFLTRAIDIFGAQLFGSPPIVFFSFSSSTVELGP